MGKIEKICEKKEEGKVGEKMQSTKLERMEGKTVFKLNIHWLYRLNDIFRANL